MDVGLAMSTASTSGSSMTAWASSNSRSNPRALRLAALRVLREIGRGNRAHIAVFDELPEPGGVDLSDHAAADESDSQWMLACHQNPPSPGETGRYRDRVPPRPAATINNRRARYDYLVIDTYECGLVLKGAEVKSIREGKAHLREAYARVQDHEVVLHGMHVAPYSYSQEELDPIRPRKLLLHQREIDEIDSRSPRRV